MNFGKNLKMNLYGIYYPLHFFMIYIQLGIKNIPQKEKSSQIKKFINQLINITNKNDEDFICEDKDKRYRVLDKMNKSEPLIIDFNLSDWKNDLVKTNDKIKLSTVTNDKLNKQYRGLVKKD